MKTFGEYWATKQLKTPGLAAAEEGDKVTITGGSLKRELKKAFEAGQVSGPPRVESPRTPEFLADLFGGGRRP